MLGRKKKQALYMYVCVSSVARFPLLNFCRSLVPRPVYTVVGGKNPVLPQNLKREIYCEFGLRVNFDFIPESKFRDFKIVYLYSLTNVL